jgi:hypothetical protein
MVVPIGLRMYALPVDARTSPDEADEIALQSLQRWARAFESMDPIRISLLYADTSLFYGSQPPLFTGRQGVADYFSGLASRTSNSVRFENLKAVRLAERVVQLATVAIFSVERNPPVTMRLTQTLVFDGECWTIASHHASPVPAAR